MGHNFSRGNQKGYTELCFQILLLLVQKRVTPTKVDNILTLDRAVMVASLVVGLKIDFAWMMSAERHERAFKTSITYPFPFLIFQMCRWSVDVAL